RFGRRDRYGEVNAEVSDGSLIQVRPSNVTAFEIDLARCPIDTAEAVAVTVDGVPVFTDMVSARSRLRLARAGPRWQVGFTPPGLQKKPGLEGPVSDVFTGPFLVVVGTQSPEAFDRRILEKEAQRFAADWELRYTKPPRVKLDHEVTPEDIADHHLVLYGGPNDNTVTARINDRLPVRVRNGAVEVGAHRVYRGEGLAAKLCYPNPLNAERLAVVIAGAGRARDIFQSNNLFGNWFQWGPYDNRTWFDYAVFDRKSRSAETCLEFGFFGHDWRLCGETTWFGDPSARAEAPARRVPRHTVPPAGRKIVYLSDLLPVSIDQHKMPVGFDTSAEGRPLSVGPADASRRVFRRGLGVHAPSKITFRLHGPETPPAERFHRFRATVGIDLEGERQVSQWRKKKEWVQFFVRGDGHLLYRTGRMKWNSKPVDIDVPVSRVEELELQVWCTNARWLVGSAAWGSARVIRQKAPGPDDAPADPGS
ncbi:MAG: NPCBM/NEW2 domain-containing protein, partial [Planctomycetota bacterium]